MAELLHDDRAPRSARGWPVDARPAPQPPGFGEAPERVPSAVELQRAAPAIWVAPRARPALSQAPVPAPGRSRRQRLLRRILISGAAPFLVGADAVAVAAMLVVPLPRLSFAALVAMLAGVLAACVMLFFSRQYQSRLTWSVWDSIPRLVSAACAAVAASQTVLDYLDPAHIGPGRLVAAVGLVIVGLVIGRTAMTNAIRVARRRGWVSYRTLIVGSGETGQRMARVLDEDRRFGLLPVGFVDARDSGPGVLPVVNDPAHLVSAVKTQRADVVIVAFPENTSSAELVEYLRACAECDVEIFWVPRLTAAHPRAAATDEIWGIPVIRGFLPPRKAFGRGVKRLVDIIVSASLLVLLAPLMAVVAALVVRETRASALFRQDRVSLAGARFSLLKFRSMTPSNDLEARTTWAIAGDSRIGPVGRFIRATSIDELPQLLNVLRGEMSLVGPRPERPHFVHQFSDEIEGYRHRHRVKAGLTGWSAVNGLRGDTSVLDRAVFDNYYVENWSLWFDLRILALTLLAVVRRTGA